MMKIFRVQLTMLVFISLLGGVVIYETSGSLSGLDAMSIAGIVSGLLIGVFSGKFLGMYSLFPSFISALVISVLFSVLAVFTMNIGDSPMIVLGQFSVGFSLLAGALTGCKWGGHLLIRDDDLLQLREVFGEHKTDTKVRQEPQLDDD